MTLYPALAETAQQLEQEFDLIPGERKQLLQQIARYIGQKKAQGQPVQLNFICTHNSRRSHLAQLWASAAAAYYGVSQVACFSGGTEATAFNPNAVQAMQQLGFRIDKTTEGENPIYNVGFSPEQAAVQVWSKTVTDAANPSTAFAAIMTCSDADQNCPVLPNADLRLALTFEDPKAFDNTPQQAEMYLARARQIGRELLYAFKVAQARQQV